MSESNAPPEHLIKRIKQIRANATFGKKKHFNAAGRKRMHQNWISPVVIVLNVVLGSALMVHLKNENIESFKLWGASLSLVAAVLAAMQKYFGFQQAQAGHDQIAGRYLDIVGECSDALADFHDGLVNREQLAKRRDSLAKSLSKINKDALAFPTNGSDYAQAKVGIDEGEEHYTEQDLGLGERLDGP